MNYRALALEFDGAGRVVEAAWAYELAIQDPAADREALLNLAVLYLVCNDTGFFAAHQLHPSFVDAAYPRALEVLAVLEARFGRSAEVEYWRLHMRERVLGEAIPAEVYERLAAQGVTAAHVSLYAASNRAEHRDGAEQVFIAARERATARQRYLLSFA